LPSQLHYELSGPSEAPVVALSCSLGTDLSMWDPQVPALSEHFRVLRYDLRGHGGSPALPGPYEIADLGDDLLTLLDRLQIERASLCGVSIGGMTSMWTAAHAPERVERLVACCTSAYIDPEGTYRERAALVRGSGLEPFADGALGRWFTPEFRRAQPELMERMRAILVASTREGYAGCCEALADMDLRDELPAIGAPTLVISGAEDPSTPPEHGRLIAERVPAARFEVVPHGAHLASIEQSERVTELILSHLHATEEEPR
jgi:3-oxoadipate enol-lactonase